jgi:hypothetical protein
VTLGARGWDNQLWRLGSDLAVRLPWATQRADTLLRKEHAWVPMLAPFLPLPVPVPQRLGEPSKRFPRAWIVTTWVPGEPADRAPATRGAAAADALAAFCRPCIGPLRPVRLAAKAEEDRWLSCRTPPASAAARAANPAGVRPPRLRCAVSPQPAGGETGSGSDRNRQARDGQRVPERGQRSGMTRYRAAPSAGTVAWITPADDIRKNVAPPTTTDCPPHRSCTR